MTPFREPEGKRACLDFREWITPKPSSGMTIGYFDVIFGIVLTSDADYDPQIDGVDLEICYDIWVCASILNAALHGTDDSADCMDYAKQYRQICSAIHTELTRTKLFSCKPRYDAAALCAQAVQALEALKLPGAELLTNMQARGEAEAFLTSVHYLQEQLSCK